MHCVILANGEYGNLEAYRRIFKEGDIILCADGGANYAYKLELIPAFIIGDMDSILPEVREFYEAKGVPLQKYSSRKDFTDTQLALNIAQAQGATEIILLGTLGKRLDHTLSNLYGGIDMVKKGMKVSHFSPECWVHIVNKEIEIEGARGDIISVLALSSVALGVTETGFRYKLENAMLENGNPYAISNVLEGIRGKITVQEGILAVFHYLS